MPNKVRGSLGKSVTPSHYKIRINTDLKNFKFTGEETIDINVNERTKIIRLNSLGLSIDKCALELEGVEINAKISTRKEFDILEIKLNREIIGKAALKINFSGTNNDGLSGFYKSSYNFKGKKEYLLTTQFEPSDARRAFPCFDEPELKATFDLSIALQSDLMALSNMPIKKETKLKNNTKLVEFEQTPKMSTYLLYFGIGRFEMAQSKAADINYRVFTTPGKLKYAKLPIEYAKRFVHFYEAYFGVKYPLKKIDLIAIPDFSAGAMENWGAITFREIDLLCDEKSAVPIKHRVATVIAHELAHQWFGDLVTMKWWNDLWLNESFASFMEIRAPDTIYPEWEMGLSFINARYTAALDRDQMNSTHPIDTNVSTSQEISQMFDPKITYGKGAAIITMLEDYVSKERFKGGLRVYIKQNAYSNTNRTDLWKAIEEVVDKNMRFSDVAEDWIIKPGHPLIEVIGPDRKGVVRLVQSRFTLIKNNDKSIWNIPIHYKSNNCEDIILMDKKSMQIKLKSGAEYIKLNTHQKGFYRVKYSGDNFEVICKHIRDGILPAVEGFGIENDLYAMALGGKIPVEKYLDFISEYCMDCGYPMNEGIVDHLYELSILLYGTKACKKLNEVSLKFNRALLKRFGWNRRKDEMPKTTIMRGKVMQMLGMLGDKATVEKLVSMFKSFVESKKEIDPNIRAAVYAVAAANGNADTYEIFKNMYLADPAPDDQRRILYAMCNFNDLKICANALEFSITNVRSQDSSLMFSAMCRNPIALPYVLDWLELKWQLLIKKYDTDMNALSDYVLALSKISGKKNIKRIRGFFQNKRNYHAKISMAIDEVAERVEINTNFIDKNKHN